MVGYRFRKMIQKQAFCVRNYPYIYIYIYILEGVDRKDTPSPNPRKLIEEVNCLHLQVKHGNFGSQQLLQVCVVVAIKERRDPFHSLIYFLFFRKLDIPFLSWVIFGQS
jgi:hypothetical protein